MRTFRFPSDNRAFINELRDRVKMHLSDKKHSRFGNHTLIIKGVFMFVLYAVPYLLLVTGIAQTPLTQFMCWALMGLGMAGLGMGLMHDANHGSLHKNQSVNKWLGKSLYLLGGFPPNWKHQHNTLHHGYTNVEGQDEDISPAGFLRFSPHRPIHKVHRYQHLYAWLLYGLMTLSWVTARDFIRFFNYRKSEAFGSDPGKHYRVFADLVISKILYYSIMLVIPLAFIQASPLTIIAGFLFMHFICGFILSTVFQTAHVMPSSDYPLPDENGNMEHEWAVHQLYTTSDYAPGNKLITWFTGGLNYQVEHHLFPNVSHVHYPEIAPLVRETAIKYNLPYYVQPTFADALHAHGKMLRLLGMPESPDKQQSQPNRGAHARTILYSSD